MSTKIYNGCLINVSTLKEYQDFINEMRELLEPAIKKIVVGQSVVNAVSIMDSIAMGKLDPNYVDVREEHVELSTGKSFITNGLDLFGHKFATDKRELGVSHESSVVFFMLEDKVLAIPYMEQPLQDIFMAQNIIQHF